MNNKETNKNHIKTIVSGVLRAKSQNKPCGQCQSSCQSACKVSCTTGNQSCQNNGSSK